MDFIASGFEADVNNCLSYPEAHLDTWESHYYSLL